MKITIHRGINQIGGCIVEIATSRTRILVDLGLNLPDNAGVVKDDFATPGKIAELTEGIDAIIYTHYHGDHIGLFNLVPEGIDQYIGKTAQKVALCKHTKLGQIKDREKLSAAEVKAIAGMRVMIPGRAFSVVDMKITPYFVSHSAYESFMLLIEADGKRILHTGDVRDHGCLGKRLMDVIRVYIRQVDVLITEGTMLSRSDERVKHEWELKQDFAALMKQYKYCFVVCSSTDLERLATVHAAHKDSKPTAPFICDEFQKDVLTIFSDSAGTKSKLFNFDDAITFESREARFWESGFTMLVRCSGKFDKWTDKLLARTGRENAVIVFSMWGEYINPSSCHAKIDYMNFVGKFKHIRKIHTSGHASKECLTEICISTNPALAIIPIHSEHSDEYRKLQITEDLKSKVITKSCCVEGVDIEIK